MPRPLFLKELPTFAEEPYIRLRKQQKHEEEMLPNLRLAQVLQSRSCRCGRRHDNGNLHQPVLVRPLPIPADEPGPIVRQQPALQEQLLRDVRQVRERCGAGGEVRTAERGAELWQRAHGESLLQVV